MTATTQAEASQIAERIAQIFQQILNEYDFGKYPAAEHARFSASFSALTATPDDIQGALVWKWGHWGKSNYPQHHRDLIAMIQNLWSSYVASGISSSSINTFQWWHGRINKQTAYTTVAFITHLIHHNEPLPIIDQHNFRAMNSLLGCVRNGWKPKKRPSNWGDIAALKSFMTQVSGALPGTSFSELDRFLMMYGRNYAAR
jgi:hypothetical protein